MGFFSGPSGSTKHNLGAKSKLQKKLEPIIGNTADLQFGQYKDLIGDAKRENSFLDQLLAQFQSEQSAANRLISPDQRAQYEAGQLQTTQQLGGAEDQALQSILGMIQQGPNATDEQLGRIRGSADLAVQTGLSDLAHFRDQTFQQIRNDSAGRGLRPTDTPILNQLGASGEEFGRQAEQFTNQVRGQQMQDELQYPFQNQQAGLGLAAGASDMANRRMGFESNLAQQSLQNRLNYAGGLQGKQLGLLTAMNPQGQLAPLIQQRVASGTTKTSTNPGGMSILSSLTAPLSSVGMLMSGKK